eukprot:1136239-Pelagomonas_calceolata.AAC.6
MSRMSVLLQKPSRYSLALSAFFFCCRELDAILMLPNVLPNVNCDRIQLLRRPGTTSTQMEASGQQHNKF